MHIFNMLFKDYLLFFIAVMEQFGHNVNFDFVKFYVILEN